jgi:A/G-specific adenine glycosylase
LHLGGVVKMAEGPRVLKPRCESDALVGKKDFRERLARWFKRHGRDYPWRRTHDPYQILVSEVMLQQTQIATVLGKGYYTRFLETFPDVGSLAAADDASLLKAWEGLGYYRRARMLRDTARAVIERHDGSFPADLDALLALPGVGRYTAGALRAFAFGLPAVLVDGNVSRVLARLMDCCEPVDGSAGQKQIREWARELADDKQPRVHHAALMELGQTICRPGVPDCLACPVARFCRTSKPAALPVKGRKVVITAVDEHSLWLRDAAGRVLMQHESGNRRTGLWKLPVRDAGEISHLPVIAEHVYAITRYRVNLRVHDGHSPGACFQPAAGEAWVETGRIAGLAMAAPFRRVLEGLLADL